MMQTNLPILNGAKYYKMENYNNRKLKRAKEKVKKIKEFYQHLTVYLLINTALILINLGIFQNGVLDWNIPKWPMFTTPFFWGVGLFFHWLGVFHNSFNFFRNWEERKIKEYMEEQDEEYNPTEKYK